jgi:5-(carboxyamino)imidazole ribonucleotide synthase
VSYAGLDEVLAISGTYVHLYGKKNTRSFRKMGHITICDNDLDQAVARARKVKEIIKSISN